MVIVRLRRCFYPALLVVLALVGAARADQLDDTFQHPPEAARPWVYWYWMNAAVSREGITADLEAMKQAGIGGAYLMPIRGAGTPPQLSPPAQQLSPLWWDMVRYSMSEADRLGIKLAMQDCDGFATAGGPWITPELSMQKVVWSETSFKGGSRFDGALPQPPAKENYYKDIAVLAFPTPAGSEVSTNTIAPTVTTSWPNANAQMLAKPGNTQTFRADAPGWIQYAFDQPFPCRSIIIRKGGNNYQGNRLLIEVSDDGDHFRSLGRLVAPRAGWQDDDVDVTHAIVPTTARFFRFAYDPADSEPGSEDLDSAKFKIGLKLQGITLSGAPRVNQFEGKTGEVWRVSLPTTSTQVPDSECVPLTSVLNITDRFAADGHLAWDAPPGNWIILRIGHTSTGHQNETGGGAKGLECDKFNPEAVRLQFDHWFGETIRQVGPELAGRVLKVFHVDSWECGSQDWSPVFRAEFTRRRGYDPLPYLPVIAGIPVQSADVSERFLHDVRQTIADLLEDNFFGTFESLAKAQGCVFSSEAVAPTMVSDDLRHFSTVDIPMGEFWLRSPTHDKPNDILDAVSGAHIYGKPLAQAEAFTEVKLGWDESPAMLKAPGDLNYAIGINRFVFHVFVHNPWLDRQPGMTLSGIGNFLQRDQTWWKPGRAWVEYTQRCQALLQTGTPVADIAVFTGEEIPSRAILPGELVAALPGLFGAESVARETQRATNTGQPQHSEPEGIVASDNIPSPAASIDPLRGYAYDSINRDALLRLAQVHNGRIELPGGASYAMLVLPAARPMSPAADVMSPEVAAKLKALAQAGATILVSTPPTHSPSLKNYPASDDAVRQIAADIWPAGNSTHRVGQGRVLAAPFIKASLDSLGIARDVIVTDATRQKAGGIAWNHRTAPGLDIYFFSNQRDTTQTIDVSLRASVRVPELWDAVTGEIRRAAEWHIDNGRTVLPLRLEPNGSIFVVLREMTPNTSASSGKNWIEPKTAQTFSGPWQVTFDANHRGQKVPITFDHLDDWTTRPEPGIQSYSGTAAYTQTFDWASSGTKPMRVWASLGRVADLAEVYLNGISCGVAWTAPYRVEITPALHPGTNTLKIEVTNTWLNRLLDDATLPPDQRTTWTPANPRRDAKPISAGLLGPVTLVTE